ncbi:cob(I)yrinic acid a,c-diamide adenosyltransferase [Halorhodospira halophila]|uniref:cob(I)yrinic acid a,c-diamide adenosyltransferase n=1 Tax=Halorhodospira halophila TaxID=1053 RepID=UPI001911D9F3|nr:cob(I)yrinic acid a,c-diamide adenosyltransferase [Halorhodospira halophila]MBK5936520.1 ATP:cob(I)alamin adenosyltransferase [Halorhodospira halophila]
MGNRLSKIATCTGDEGRTGLGDGSRVDKDSHRVEAFGEVDELNSFLGRLLAHELPEDVAPVLAQVQHELFDLGAELAVPGHKAFPEGAVDRLDAALSYFNDSLPYLKEFILPGGGRATADCHVARAVCRRAERKAVALSHHEAVRPESMAYLNRLSDLLFVVARVLSRYENGGEVLWRPAGQRAADESA